MSSVRRRVLIGTSTAPILITANIASMNSGRFTIQSATFSPGRTPSAMSPRASRSMEADSSAKLQRRPLK